MAGRQKVVESPDTECSPTSRSVELPLFIIEGEEKEIVTDWKLAWRRQLCIFHRMQ
jgi:hypothetical protein